MNLFAYGTLLFPEVWRAVLGRERHGQPATVRGYAVRCVRGDVFPVMIEADENATAHGAVFRDLDAATFAVLDAYESELYDRVSVQAQLTKCECVACHAYALPRHRAVHASGDPWDADTFRCDELQRYLQRIQ